MLSVNTWLGALLFACLTSLASPPPPPSEGSAPPAPPPIVPRCERGDVCILDGKASFERGASFDDKARAKEAKKRAKSNVRVRVSVTIDGGRGSVFVDGRWINLAPIGDLELTPGRHDLEVRDRDVILARGVLDLSANAKTKRDASVSLVVAGR
jgi:hypothetical protein